jgi:hypothetical protein
VFAGKRVAKESLCGRVECISRVGMAALVPRNLANAAIQRDSEN